VNAHGATKQAAVTSLHGIVNFVMHHNRLWLFRLRLMPFFLLTI
jgi:hypothetical protein